MVVELERHSTLDNYWRFVYERLVRFYKQQTTYMKSLCKTFVDRAQQLQFVNLYLESHNLLCKSQYKFDLEVIAKAPVLLQAKTEDIGIVLEFLSRQDELPTSVQVYQSGIYLGSSKLKTF